MSSILRSRLIRSLISYLATGISLIPIAMVYAYLMISNVSEIIYFYLTILIGGLVGYLLRMKYEKLLLNLSVSQKFTRISEPRTDGIFLDLHLISDSSSAATSIFFITLAPNEELNHTLKYIAE